MLKVYILIVVLGLVGGVVYGGYYYYKDTQARIQTLTENSAKLEQAAEEQQRQETARQIAAAAQAFQSTGDYDEFSGAGGNVDPGGPASRMDWSALTDDEGDKYATGGVATMFTRRR